MLVFLYTETVFEFPFATTGSGLPSPSISAAQIDPGDAPVDESTFGAKDLALNPSPFPLNVAAKGCCEYAVRLLFVTVIKLYPAPEGTCTVNEVDVAAETFALTAPKYTTLLPGLALNPEPLIKTVVPTDPEPGAKLLITGCEFKMNVCEQKNKTRIYFFSSFIVNVFNRGLPGNVFKVLFEK